MGAAKLPLSMPPSKDQHQAPANLMTHDSSRGIPVRAIREPHGEHTAVSQQPAAARAEGISPRRGRRIRMIACALARSRCRFEGLDGILDVIVDVKHRN